MSYQNSPCSIEEDQEIVVPLGTTSTPPPPSTTTRAQWRAALVVGMLLLLLMMLAGGGGVVGRRPEGSSSTTAAEGLVVGDAPCVPATDTFTGGSVTTWYGKSYPFETCYKLDLGGYDEDKFCWSKSYHSDYYGVFYQCIPNPKNGGWYALEYASPNSCGPPCQDMYQD